MPRPLMNHEFTKHPVSRTDIVALASAALFMLLVMSLHLLSALIAGLLVHELVHSLARRLRVAALDRESAKLLAVALLTGLVVAIVTAATFGLISLMRHGSESLPELFRKLAEALDDSRGHLPTWLVTSLPADADEIRGDIVAWLREHSSTLQGFGKSFGRGLAHVLIGIIVGAMLALRDTAPLAERGPLSQAIADRATRLASAFRRVVFAQTWIATLNAGFTWLYIGVALPLFGVHLPQVKTLVTVTWVAGLVPILGNLISNTVIVVVSLSQSLELALASLLFLIVIHKLEYFLNARIIGSQIRSRAWELLIAMLVMETAFGIAGIIAAPIFYAYLKDELARLRLI
jgi:predicted PurR-regulated permease PerM